MIAKYVIAVEIGLWSDSLYPCICAVDKKMRICIYIYIVEYANFFYNLSYAGPPPLHDLVFDPLYGLLNLRQSFTNDFSLATVGIVFIGCNH